MVRDGRTACPGRLWRDRSCFGTNGVRLGRSLDTSVEDGWASGLSFRTRQTARS